MTSTGLFYPLSACLLVSIVAVPRVAPQVPQPSARSYLDQSLRYYQQGKFADSIAAALEALRLQPDNEFAGNNLAWAQAQQAK
jgi:hypothetical protein